MRRQRKFPIFSAQERMNGETYSFTHAWQPLAATCSHSSGRQWPPSFSFHRQPLAPPCGQSSGRQSSGRQSSGRKWPPVATSIWFFIGSHLQPLAATRVAASGRQRAPAFSFHRQPLAATCSQSSGRKWPPEQVAASGRKWPQVAASGRFCQNQIRALLHALCDYSINHFFAFFVGYLIFGSIWVKYTD